jgi:reverse gyrase
MERIITNITIENLQSKFHFDNQTADLEDVKETGSAIAREPDFAELHALYEIQYEQFLTDTSHEISKCAQRLSELESIVYGNPSSERVAYRHDFKSVLPFR